MSAPSLVTSQVADRFIQENFRALKQYFARNTNLVGFKHLEITLTSATIGKEVLFPHGLGYVPKDVLVTSTRGPSILQFNYTKFDLNNISLTPVSGDAPTDSNPIIVRLYVGTHAGGNQ